jgi:hypothetical protein
MNEGYWLYQGKVQEVEDHASWLILNASFNIKKNYQDAISHLDRASVNKPIVPFPKGYKPTTFSRG